MILMMAAALLLTGISGVPGLFLKKGSGISQRIATTLHLLGCAAGLISTAMVFMLRSFHAQFYWPLPGGSIAIHVDALSALFLLPLFLVMGMGSLYGEGYWSESSNPQTGRKLRFFYGALTAGFALILIAGDAWSFLTGWEIVGLAAYFLVTTESEKEEALRAGWIYLIAAHISTLILFAMFGAIHNLTGTWLIGDAIRSSTLIPPILLLALAGFGIKAGLMPFHVWLPEAHTAAPSHVSAILSGIVLKMGVYGIVRLMMSMNEVPAWFGALLLFAGLTSGILGVVFALAQHDLKRLLAYHSIENIGIIFIGIGAFILGRNHTWGTLALAGALLHVWNHAFFKTLLFFAAGSVAHATGTRSIDKLGGLLKNLRVTGLSFLVGAVAICGLPPLNGFVSEWLIYVSGFRAIIAHTSNAMLPAVPALALIGALAVACFVKAFSVVFLGHARSNYAHALQKEPLSMRVAMTMAIVLCVVIGVWPLAVYGALSSTVAQIVNDRAGIAEIHALFTALPVAGSVTLALLLAAAVAIAILIRGRRQTVTWDCGYAAPATRMQYTSSSFASPLTGLFGWALHEDVRTTGVSLADKHNADGTSEMIPGVRPSTQRLFPENGSFESHVPDPVLDRILTPAILRAKRGMAFGRGLQSGRIQIYIVYIVVTLLLLLAWSAL